jgi:hypothetical protein
VNRLCETLQDPTVVRDWQARDWNAWLPLARDARLLVYSLQQFDENGVLDAVPARLVDQLRGAEARTRYVQGQARYELRLVQKALAAQDIPVLALKGVAYLVAELPGHRWRSLSDIDLLVRKGDLATAERVLMQGGWRPNGEFDAYDQHYYRAWMHEIPPMRHAARETEVDLHHNLAPPVSRIRIDAAELWTRTREGPEWCGTRTRVLGPEDLLLHNAVHLFMNDELRGGLRDVVDFRDLFVHFVDRESNFPEHLVTRADQLGCGRPLYYALSTARRLLAMDIPAPLERAASAWAPVAPVAALMAWLIDRALAPSFPGQRTQAIARQLLFIRSHWIRMPPGMLLRHLWRKAVLKRRARPTESRPIPG